MYVFLIVLLLLSQSESVFSQEKFERESRMSRDQVPTGALSFMDSLHFQPKIRWYLEEGLTQNSVEAKFKWDKARYSVEFNMGGQIEDIEVEIGWEDLSDALRDSILLLLRRDCSRFKVEKIQKQLSGSRDALWNFLNGRRLGLSLVTRYECVVRCRGEQGLHLYEYLFDEGGSFLHRSKIVFRKSSHLEY